MVNLVSYVKGEYRLRAVENRILRRIFGPERDENEEWRDLYNEKLIVCTVHLIPNEGD